MKKIINERIMKLKVKIDLKTILLSLLAFFIGLIANSLGTISLAMAITNSDIIPGIVYIHTVSALEKCIFSATFFSFGITLCVISAKLLFDDI